MKRAQQRAAELARQAWSEHTAETRARHADFDAVVSKPDLDITPLMAEALRDVERGGDVAYFLGQNPDEATRIARLSVSQQVREIERLNQQFADAAIPSRNHPKRRLRRRRLRAAPARPNVNIRSGRHVL